MAKKLTLQPSPTFKAMVDIHVPGGEAVKVEFTFKAKRKSELHKYIIGMDANSNDTEMVMDIASGWGLEDAFTKENVEQLCESYIGAARAIWEKYLDEISGARLGN